MLAAVGDRNHAFKTGDPGIAAGHPKIRRLLATDTPKKRADFELFYRDPMRHSVPEYRGFWLAAMVRAQGAPFVVIAQRRNPLSEVAFAVLQSFLPGSGEPPGYDEVSVRLGKSIDAVKMQVSRLRHHFRRELRAELLRTVSSPEEVDEELGYLRRILAS